MAIGNITYTPRTPLYPNDIIDNLLCDLSNLPLSAKQGMILNNKITDYPHKFVNQNLNSINIDTTEGNWCVGLIGKNLDGLGNNIPFNGWQNIIQFECRHFFTQIATTVCTATNQTPQVAIRSRYYNTDFGQWIYFMQGGLYSESITAVGNGTDEIDICLKFNVDKNNILVTNGDYVNANVGIIGVKNINSNTIRIKLSKIHNGAIRFNVVYKPICQ